MKGLFLYGMKCQSWIWDQVNGDLTDCDIDYVAYPGEVTRTCTSVSELTEWVGEQYLSRGQAYDFVLGHSMGGLIALQLSALVASPSARRSSSSHSCGPQSPSIAT